jgi:hypothetical protein
MQRVAYELPALVLVELANEPPVPRIFVKLGSEEIDGSLELI